MNEYVLHIFLIQLVFWNQLVSLTSAYVSFRQFQLRKSSSPDYNPS